MRRRFLLGLGLAGVLSGPALAQLPPGSLPPAALPPGVRPATPGGAYVPPVDPFGAAPAARPGGFTAGLPVEPPAPPPPRDLELRRALPPDHPWALKPEHGAYFICVKSYSRPSKPEPGDTAPTALAMAEALATDIRDLYRVETFLFEYISEERKAEMASIAAARERARIFQQQIEQRKQESQLRGMTFLEPDRKIYFKTQKYNDQIAVLVGPWKTEKEAREAINTVRTWPAPKNTTLMDGAVVVQTRGDGKGVLEKGHLNPYLTANVVPNPSVPRAAPQPGAEPGVDPLIVKMNEGRPYSLLKATKGWTLAVKSFNAPTAILGHNDTSGAMRKFDDRKAADVLQAGAEQAEAMAKMLRQMKGLGDSLNLEAFVLHTRNGSIVTVGQFDGPNDPSLVHTRQLLARMTVQVSEDKDGKRPVLNQPPLFGNMLPIPIPKP